MAKLSIVGVGPGSPEYVTLAARKVVQHADVVLGAKRNLRLIQGDIKGGTVTLTAQNMEDALQNAVDAVKKGKNVVLVATGDPGFSGLLGSILNRKLDNDIEVNVVAGVSAVQVCAARLGMCWDNIALFTFHDGATEEKKAALADAVVAGQDVMLLPEPKAFTPNHIAHFLLTQGIEKETPVAVCENLTLDNEKVVQTTLQEATQLSFASLCIMVIKSSLKEKRTE